MDIALTPTREGKTKRSGSIGDSSRDIDGYSQPKKIRRSSDNRHSLLTVIINFIHILFVSCTSSRLFTLRLRFCLVGFCPYISHFGQKIAYVCLYLDIDRVSMTSQIRDSSANPRHRRTEDSCLRTWRDVTYPQIMFPNRTNMTSLAPSLH